MGARDVFVKVNSDASYRARFLKDPIGVLKTEGITLDAKDKKQLLEVIDTVKKNLPKLGELPSGYDDLIEKVAGKDPPAGNGVGMLII